MNLPFKGINLSQFLLGLGNSQNVSFVTNEQKRIVEILPGDIEYILNSLLGSRIESDHKNDFAPPELNQKNKLNGISDNQYKILQDDYVQFGKIDEILRNNSNRDIRDKYFAAARILQLQYVTTFEGKMPEFLVQVIAMHSRQRQQDATMLVKMHLLLNYMYCNCDLGIKPNEN